MSEHQPLKDLKKKLTAEITDLENRVRPLQEELSRKREMLSKVNDLLSLFDSVSKPTAVESAPVSPQSNSSARASGKDTSFTPTSLYWPAILQVLVDLGGGGSGETVTDRVGEKLKDVLKPADHQRLASGVIRWRNRVAWQRFNMIHEGLLNSDSPRGIWEITDKGRAWLTNAKAA